MKLRPIHLTFVLLAVRPAFAQDSAKAKADGTSAVAVPVAPPAIQAPHPPPPDDNEPPPNKQPHDPGSYAHHHQPPPDPCYGQTDPCEHEEPFEGTHKKDLRLVGSGEFFYAYNFNNPSNGITNARGFDNRHNTFSVSNLSFGFEGELNRVAGKIILQYGLTPDVYYASEPSKPGSALASATSAATWKYIQEANVSVDLSRHFVLDGGIFLSPIGPETIPVAKNWNWSRSNLFFALPYYHTGLRVAYRTEQKTRVTEDGRELVCINEQGDRVTCPGNEPMVEEKEGWNFSLAAYNGWNSVVDNNEAKSIALGADFTRSRKIKGEDTETFNFHALYFGGIERNSGDKDGAYWRNDLDVSLRGRLGESTSVMLHANGGIEPTRFGPTWWAGAALYGRQGLSDWLSVAARIDGLRQREAQNDFGVATPLFFSGARWVSSGTVTLEAKASKIASIRLEYRHDEAERPLFFFSQVAGNGTTAPYVPNSVRQDTILLGVAANCCDVR